MEFTMSMINRVFVNDVFLTSDYYCGDLISLFFLDPGVLDRFFFICSSNWDIITVISLRYLITCSSFEKHFVQTPSVLSGIVVTWQIAARFSSLRRSFNFDNFFTVVLLFSSISFTVKKNPHRQHMFVELYIFRGVMDAAIFVLTQPTVTPNLS